VIDGGLSQHFQKNLPLWDWQRVENSAVGRGVPDLNGCFNGTEVWIENKTTEAWKVDLRPEQSAWAARRARAGGRVFIAVRRLCKAGPRRPGADELYLFGAHQGQDLITQSLKTVIPLGLWVGRPASWGWPAIQNLLLTSQDRIAERGRVAL
jgi:hypothetical protein